MIIIQSVICGIGNYIPPDILSNKNLTEMVDTSDEWILKRTGISERHIAKNMSTGFLAVKASLNAIQNAKIALEDIDLIIATTLTPDYFTPSLACIVQGEIGAKNAICFDISAACSSFPYALDIADNYIRLGKSKTVLIVCSEVMSKIIDYSDRGTCVLFGDGAGAVVLKASDTEDGIIETFLNSDGGAREALVSCALPVEDPFAKNRAGIDASLRFLKMNGNDVLRFAVKAVPHAIDEVLARANKKIEDIDWIIPHQANIRIIDNIILRYKLDPSKVYVNLPKYGNTSSASIPIALSEMSEQNLLKKGQLAIFVGFGAGLTYGATLIRI